MKKSQMRIILLIIGIFIITLVRAQEGEQLFKTNCAACHTIGKGRLVGPDLLNVTEKRSEQWLISFIKSSTSKIKSGDADANAIFKEYNSILMPDMNYSEAQIINILGYIKLGGAGTAGQENNVITDILSGTTVSNVNAGTKLFSGNKLLTNGGPACTSCHKVRDERIFSSGTLAKDLSQSFELIGSAGISGIIRNPPFPVMAATYKNHPLTGEEIVNLTAYLASVSQERIYQRSNDFSIAFVFFGIIVFTLILMTMVILYFNRKRLAVNHEILSRSSSVVN